MSYYVQIHTRSSAEFWVLHAWMGGAHWVFKSHGIAYIAYERKPNMKFWFLNLNLGFIVLLH